MARADRASRAGFTLLEGLAALTILGAVTVAALGALGSNTRATERARHALVASALAEDRLTALRLLPAAELHPLRDSLRSGRFPGELSAYQWTADVRPATVDAALLQATVVVRWGGGSETLETLLLRSPG